MVDHEYAPQWHWVWSDGCASQFKSNKPWFSVSRYPSMTRGYQILWNFFGSGHGKGPHDGARVVVKIFLRKEKFHVHWVKLHNAKEVVPFSM